MDRTAGFAASIALREELIQSMVRVLYNAGRLDHTINVNAPTVLASLFLSLPEVSYPPNASPRLAIELYAWGPMRVTPPGGQPENRRVKFRARVLVAQTVSVSAGRLSFGLDTASATVSNVQIDPYSGGLFSPAAVTYLTSPEFLALVTLGLQAQLAEFGQLLPPLDLAFLGAIAVHPSTTARHVTVDQALVIGLDINADGVETDGRPELLGDMSAGNDIGMWTNPRAVPVAYADVRHNIEEEIAKQDATLDDFNLAVEEDWLHVSGKASKTGGSVTFSVHAVPRLFREGECFEWDEQFGEHFEYCDPDRHELWFEPTDVAVDIDRRWWVVVLETIAGLITFGIGIMVVEAIIGMIRGNITSGINQNTAARADRNQDFTIPGVSRPPMRLRIEQFECHAEGVFVGLTITPQFWSWYGKLEGPQQVGVEEALVETMRFKIDLPPDVLVDDPELRVRWTVRRTDTNEILVSRDNVASVGLTLEFDKSNVPFLELQELSIEVRVYRTLGAGVEEILYKIQKLRVTDYVDRSHPYVQWHHQAMVPLVRVEPDGSHRVLGLQIIGRQSAIHRTALPGRCRMLRNYSLNKIFPTDGHFFPLEYSDELPFPLADLVANRDQVCDYCFFGGPTKGVPLIPIS
jgi:hypothetical protein